MQQDAIDSATQALEKYNIETLSWERSERFPERTSEQVVLNVKTSFLFGDVKLVKSSFLLLSVKCVFVWNITRWDFLLLITYNLKLYPHYRSITPWYTSSTAQGGGGSFKNRKPIGDVGCCESGMAERSHWLTERWLELCLLEWLQWLQWSPHPQLLDVVWCTATVVVVVA